MLDKLNKTEYDEYLDYYLEDKEFCYKNIFQRIFNWFYITQTDKINGVLGSYELMV